MGGLWRLRRRLEKSCLAKLLKTKDDGSPMLSRQDSEEFHRNVAPKKNDLTNVLSLLKDGRGNSPEPEKEDDDQGRATSSDAAPSEALFDFI